MMIPFRTSSRPMLHRWAVVTCTLSFLILLTQANVFHHQRRGLDLYDRTATIRLAVSSWNSSQLVHEIARILIEERLGVPVTFVDRTAITETILVREPANSTFDWSSASPAFFVAYNYADADLEAWDRPKDFNRTAHLPDLYRGYLGYVGREGWYMTEYATQVNPDVQSYIALKNPRNAQIFAPGFNATEWKAATSLVSNVTALTNSALALPVCTASGSGFNVTSCVEQSLQLALGTGGSGSASRGKLIVPDQVLWLLRDQAILRGLDLPLDMVEIGEPVEENVVATIVSAYRARRPWLGFIYEPHPIFSPLSGVKLVSLSMPDYSPDCEAKLDNVPPTHPCGYPPVFVRKLVSHRVEQLAPQVYEFMRKLTITQDDIMGVMAQTYFNHRSIHEAACEWVISNRAVWQPMVPSIQLTFPSCPQGTEARKAGRFWSCPPCIKGYFNLAANSTCKPCPSGAVCPGGGAILADTNQFYLPESELVNQGVPEFYPCPAENRCCESGECALNSTCPAGFGGNLCAGCSDPRLYRWGSACADCERNQSWWAVAVPVLASALIMLVFTVFGSRQENQFLSDMLLFFQLASIVIQSEDVSKLFFLFFASLNVTGMTFGLIPPGVCVLPIGALGKVVMQALFPFWLWSLVGFYHFGSWVVVQARSHIRPLRHAFRATFQTIQALHQFYFIRHITIFTLSYMPIVQGALIILNCRTIGKSWFLAEAPEVECFVGGHLTAAIYAIVVLVIWVGFVPVYIFRKLRALQLSKRLHEPEVWANWGTLCCCYKRDLPTYSALDLAKCASVVMICVLLPSNTATEQMTSCVVLLTVMWLLLCEHYYSRPLHSTLDNQLRALTYGCMLMLTASAMIRVPPNDPSKAYVDSLRLVYLMIFLVSPCLLLPWLMIAHCLTLRRKAQEIRHRRQSMYNPDTEGGRKRGKQKSRSVPVSGESVTRGLSRTASVVSSAVSSGLLAGIERIDDRKAALLERVYLVFGDKADLQHRSSSAASSNGSISSPSTASSSHASSTRLESSNASMVGMLSKRQTSAVSADAAVPTGRRASATKATASAAHRPRTVSGMASTISSAFGGAGRFSSKSKAGQSEPSATDESP
ncbi:hypothetical protein BCR44DRAFT_1451456 [Catenaria anguillulae PL171]|uniref:ABC-type glycine betaine transport system substrate-binding domain-containing protein n=1 Tax=Catenaria anguillulae PL171 TaxID=765915 RepID=A0A1Y2H4B2_9FUNG|nr:hypothetical protein BCR44DRAFT_1451456 [Catenaria anguillulae PL171]